MADIGISKFTASKTAQYEKFISKKKTIEGKDFKFRRVFLLFINLEFLRTFLKLVKSPPIHFLS
jgi:hypothetical protein